MMKPEICRACPAYDSPGPVWASLNTNPRLIIVGEAPGEQEAEKGEGFVGKSGQLLWYMARKANVFREQCHVTNIAKCNTKHLGAFKYCSDHFLKPELESLPPNTPILALGDIAKNFLYPELAHLTITGLRGTRKGRVFFALHPAYIHRIIRKVGEGSGEAQSDKQDLSPTLAMDIYESVNSDPDDTQHYRNLVEDLWT